jgi:hypothetical protein
MSLSEQATAQEGEGLCKDKDERFALGGPGVGLADLQKDIVIQAATVLGGDRTGIEGVSFECQHVKTLNAPKKERRASRSSRKSGRSSTVLSKVAESNQDVHFRIEFFVGGKLANDAVKAVCGCEGVTVKETQDILAHPGRKHGRQKGTLVSCHFTVNNELAKITFRSGDTFDEVPSVAGMLQANTSVAVKLIAVDAADGTCDREQFMDVAGWLGEDKKYRQKYAFVFVQTDRAAFQEGEDLNETCASGQAGVKHTWDENLLWFEREYGSVWNFGPIPDYDPYEFHNVFQEIADKLVSEDSDDECCKPVDEGLARLKVASDTSVASSTAAGRLLAMGKTISGKITRNGKRAKTTGNFPFEESKHHVNSEPGTPKIEPTKPQGSAVVRAISAQFKRTRRRSNTDPAPGASDGPSGNFPFEEFRDPASSEK